MSEKIIEDVIKNTYEDVCIDMDKIATKEDLFSFNVVFESTCARFERTIKRQFIVIIIAIIAVMAACASVVISNKMWLNAWMEYDYSSETTESVELNSDSAPATYIKGEGNEVSNGIGKGDDKEKAETEEDGEYEDEKEKVDDHE